MGCTYSPLGKGGAAPRCIPPAASAVEQIGDHGPVERAGDAGLKHGADDPPEMITPDAQRVQSASPVRE